ncbi:MAG: GNAT family N-acetyltransferase [Solirubrobacterales bacterium]
MPAAAGVEVTPLTPTDVPAAVGVLARGMRDNPIHVAVLGPDPERRERLLARMFSALWRQWDQQHALCARRDGELVGVCGRLAPGACRLTPMQSLHLAPVLAAGGPRTLLRSLRWVGAWAKRDPKERHEHLGPVAVDRHLQGLGMGSMMLAVHAEDLDVRRLTGWLETDKEVNVRFYERFGYEVVEQADVLGVANWFMRRPPSGR